MLRSSASVGVPPPSCHALSCQQQRAVQVGGCGAPLKFDSSGDPQIGDPLRAHSAHCSEEQSSGAGARADTERVLISGTIFTNVISTLDTNVRKKCHWSCSRVRASVRPAAE